MPGGVGGGGSGGTGGANAESGNDALGNSDHDWSDSSGNDHPGVCASLDELARVAGDGAAGGVAGGAGSLGALRGGVAGAIGVPPAGVVRVSAAVFVAALAAGVAARGDGDGDGLVAEPPAGLVRVSAAVVVAAPAPGAVLARATVAVVVARDGVVPVVDALACDSDVAGRAGAESPGDVFAPGVGAADPAAPGDVLTRGSGVPRSPGDVFARGATDAVGAADAAGVGDLAGVATREPATGVLRGVVAVVVLRTVAASNGFAEPAGDRAGVAAVSLISSSSLFDWTCGVNWSPFHSSMPSTSISSTSPGAGGALSLGGAGLVTVRWPR